MIKIPKNPKQPPYKSSLCKDGQRYRMTVPKPVGLLSESDEEITISLTIKGKEITWLTVN